MRNSLPLLFARRLAAVGFMATLSGCASWNVGKLVLPESPGAPDLRPIRQERAKQAVSRFDMERDRAQYEAAATAWRQGDFTGCRESLEKVLLRTPGHRDSLLLSAELELEQDHPSEAVEFLRQGVSHHPQDAEVAYKLGMALEADHQSSEALHFFQLATQLAPEETRYAQAFELVQSQLQQTDATAMVSDASAKAEPPTVPVVLQEAGAPATATAAALQEPEVPSAETITEITEISSVPRPTSPAFERLLASRETTDVRSFQRALAQFLAKEPKHIEANILQAEIDLENARDAEARERMERMVIRNPHNPQVRRACGLVYQALGAEDRAAACFARAEELERGLPEGSTPVIAAAYEADAAEVAVAAPEPPSATVEISPPEVAAEVPPVANVPLTAAQRMERGLALLQLAQADDARKEIFAAIEAEPKNQKFYTDAALKAVQTEQLELAREIALAGTAQFPQSAGLHRLHGTAALRLQRYAEAEAALQQSLSLDNSQALTYFLLGSALDRSGKTDSAQWYLRQAARLDGRYAVRR
ncbi:MAG: hypothetical protein J0M17_11575 [Planctomycetes bacterium]|nr:hypothetical protein [Planctomycetota bacterium]